MGRNYVSMNVDVDIDMSDFDDDDLIEELESRDYTCINVKVSKRDRYGEFVYPEFKNQLELQEFIKGALGLSSWHDKQRIMKEIDDLFS